MIRELFDGLYNNLLVIWLETVWLIRSPFTYVYKQNLGDVVFQGWIEIMPSAQLMRYCDFRGSLTFRYHMLGLYTFQYRRLSKENQRGEVVDDDVKTAIEKAHENLFYSEVDRKLR